MSSPALPVAPPASEELVALERRLCDPRGSVEDLAATAAAVRSFAWSEHARREAWVNRRALAAGLSVATLGRLAPVLVEPPGEAAEETVWLDLAALGEKLVAVLDSGAEAASESGSSVWLVGGMVRDLLLGLPPGDPDLLVLGNEEAFCSSLARRLGAEQRPNHRFRTTKLALDGGQVVDVAGVRAEAYPEPAALPAVLEGGVFADLFRRDFSVNTLLVPLAGPARGLVVDLLGGLADLADRHLRPLHGMSFVDDPTRIYRALRFERSRDLRLTTEGRRWMRWSIDCGYAGLLSPARLRADLVKLCRRIGEVPRVVERLIDERLPPFAFIRRPIKVESARPLETLSRFLSTPELAAELGASGESLHGEKQGAWRLFLTCATLLTPSQETLAFADRSGERHLIDRLRSRVDDLAAALRQPRVPLSRLLDLTSGCSAAEVVAAAALLGPREPPRLAALLEARRTAASAEIRGQDLIDLGYSPGPAIGQALAEVERAIADGEISAPEALEYGARLVERSRRKGGGG